MINQDKITDLVHRLTSHSLLKEHLILYLSANAKDKQNIVNFVKQQLLNLSKEELIEYKLAEVEYLKKMAEDTQNSRILLEKQLDAVGVS
jgi:hypothetical protein